MHRWLGADSWPCANLCGVSHSTVKHTLSFGESSTLKGQRHCLFPKASSRLKPARKEQTRGTAWRDQGAPGPDVEGQAVTPTLPPGSPGVWPLRSAVGLDRQPPSSCGPDLPASPALRSPGSHRLPGLYPRPAGAPVPARPCPHGKTGREPHCPCPPHSRGRPRSARGCRGCTKAGRPPHGARLPCSAPPLAPPQLSPSAGRRCPGGHSVTTCSPGSAVYFYTHPASYAGAGEGGRLFCFSP